jgi:ParB-like chromosome segregation protein Spo0J
MVRYTTNFSAKVSEIIPYNRNARQHNAAQIAQIAASIREFGFTNPVLVDESLTLIAGHGRLSAAQLLGLDTIPAIRIDGLTDAQKQALRIADNKLALNAGWDDDLLRTELAELRDIGFDLALTGFGDDELDALFGTEDQLGAGAGSLAERFGIPPFSVLNAREGWWQDRKAAWIALGIKSEIGRGENELGLSAEAEDYRRNRGDYVKGNATPGGGANARR